jgi:arginine decarboxylase-like protein
MDTDLKEKVIEFIAMLENCSIHGLDSPITYIAFEQLGAERVKELIKAFDYAMHEFDL